MLLADETKILSADVNFRVAKDVMGKIMKLLKEKTNEAREESLTLGKASADSTNLLGVWLGEKEDTKVRIKRGMWARCSVMKKLKHTWIADLGRARKSRLLQKASCCTFVKLERGKKISWSQYIAKEYREMWCKRMEH